MESMRKAQEHIAMLVVMMHKKIVAIESGDRGDVPGWVLITVMTAGLVVAIWSIAGPELKSVLNNALHSVTTP